MASIRTTDFASLTDDIQEVFNEVAKSSINEMVGKQVFRIMETNRLTYDYVSLHGLNVIKKVAQGEDFPSAEVQEGDTATWTQAQYAGLVSVTKQMRKFDLTDQIESIVRSVADEAFQLVDQSLADVLTNGFSSSNYTDVYGQSVAATTPDGVAVFSASHTNPLNSRTFRNLIRYNGSNNPVISREAIVEARVDAMNYKDPANVSRRVNLNTLLVAPAKEDEAMRIAESQYISGTNDNDINPLKGKVKVVSWEKLTTRTGGTDTSAYWFMYDSKKVGESLRALFSEKPTIDPPEQVYKNKNWDYSLDYFYTIGRAWPAYVRGSNASGS